MTFPTPPPASDSSVPLPLEQQAASPSPTEEQTDYTTPETKQARSLEQTKQMPALHNSLPVSNTVEILTQSSLSELRAIAREYDITTNGLSKHQLAEAIVDVLKQPEAIRRVGATLEKKQRQLLAALTLARRSMKVKAPCGF